MRRRRFPALFRPPRQPRLGFGRILGEGGAAPGKEGSAVYRESTGAEPAYKETMKAKSCLLLLATALLAANPARAADKAQADDKPALHVSVIESVSTHGNAFTDFDRLDLALQYVAGQRQWPVKIDASRLAGNTPEHAIELRVTLLPIRREPIEDYVLRAWVTLVIEGKKRDFGILTAHYSARLGEDLDDIYEKTFRVSAAAIADKIEPVLFPNLKKDQPK
jgi:hypothetical protein